MRKKKNLREIWSQERIVWYSIITIGSLFIPTGIIHEVGHIVVCTGSGFDYTLNLLSIAFSVQCSDSPRPIELYWAMGGIFGMLSSSVLLISKWVRTQKGVLIGVIVTAFDHFQKSLMETFAHSSYLSNGTSLIFMSIIVLIVWGILLWRYGYRPYKKA